MSLNVLDLSESATEEAYDAEDAPEPAGAPLPPFPAAAEGGGGSILINLVNL
jgi:hypothetical protein